MLWQPLQRARFPSRRQALEDSNGLHRSTHIKIRFQLVVALHGRCKSVFSDARVDIVEKDWHYLLFSTVHRAFKCSDSDRASAVMLLRSTAEW